MSLYFKTVDTDAVMLYTFDLWYMILMILTAMIAIINYMSLETTTTLRDKQNKDQAMFNVFIAGCLLAGGLPILSYTIIDSFKVYKIDKGQVDAQYVECVSFNLINSGTLATQDKRVVTMTPKLANMYIGTEGSNRMYADINGKFHILWHEYEKDFNRIIPVEQCNEINGAKN